MDIQQYVKVEERPIVQVIQNSSVPPNPPRQMEARFSPLRLPTVLHDIPQNYSQCRSIKNVPFFILHSHWLFLFSAQ